MPEESQKELFRNLEFKMDSTTDVLFYKLDDIFKQLESNANDERDRFIESTANQDILGVQTYISQVNDTLNLLDASVIRIGTRVERAIMATAPKGAEVTTDIVKAAVEEEKEKKDSLGQITDIVTLVKEQSPANVLDLVKTAIAENKPKGNIVDGAGEFPVDLAQKMGPVLDNAAVFLKNWASPERVGLALGAGLAIPIVGGIGVAAVGLYFIFDRIADAVERISDNTTSLLKGGFKGLLFGNSEVVKAEPDRREQVPQETLDVNWLTGFGNGVNERLTEISLHTSAIQRSILGFAAFGTNAITETTEKDQNEDQLQRVQYENAIEHLPIYDYTYQERILNVLSSPVQVKLVDMPTPETNKQGDAVDVFSNAVRPLVDGQVSLQRMLDGNLRKLTEAVASLREVPRESEDRITRITDSLNTEMSDDSVRMILSETRVISGLLSDIHVDISSLYNAYKDNNREESSGSVEVPTPVDMN